MSSYIKKFDTLAEAIVTEALVMVGNDLPSQPPYPAHTVTRNAAWDTGAQFSIISPRIVETLKLKPFRKGGVMGIGGDKEVNTYIVHIGLPNGKMVFNAEVYCSDIDDYDVLLGMDIITLTDFLITNADDKTTFQFRIPSEGDIKL